MYTTSIKLKNLSVLALSFMLVFLIKYQISKYSYFKFYEFGFLFNEFLCPASKCIYIYGIYILKNMNMKLLTITLWDLSFNNGLDQYILEPHLAFGLCNTGTYFN